MYLLGTNDTRETAIIRRMYYGPDGLERLPVGGQPPHDENGVEFPFITWGFRALRGRDQRKIQDEAVEIDTNKGTAKMKTGTAIKSRVLGSIVFVDGLGWANGQAVDAVSERLYDDLKVWQINRIAVWIDEINQDGDLQKKAEEGE